MLTPISKIRLVMFCACILLSGCDGREEMPSKTYPPLEGVTVEVGVRSISDVAVIVETVFKNHGSTPIDVYKAVMFDGGVTGGPLFRVKRGGADIPYIGLLVSAREPQPEDYYHLRPGGQFKSEIDLADSYDLSARGTYSVAYDTQWFLPDATGKMSLFQVSSNTAEFALKRGITRAHE